MSPNQSRQPHRRRLNAYLARAGVASRRGADELIKAGRVRVNGRVGELNTFVEPRDVVELDGERLAPQQPAYLLLNKPPGVVTTARDPRLISRFKTSRTGIGVVQTPKLRVGPPACGAVCHGAKP